MTDKSFDPLPIPPLPVGPIGTRSLGWWGMIAIIATEGALFLWLFLTYFYFAVQQGQAWYPNPRPSFDYSGPSTAVMVISIATMWWASLSAARGRRGPLSFAMLLTLMLGLGFLALQAFEWHSKSFGLGEGTYGSVWYTLSGFHLAHTLVGVVILLFVLIWSLLGYFDARRYTPVVVAAAYWYFVVGLWLLVFITLNCTPYLW